MKGTGIGWDVAKQFARQNNLDADTTFDASRSIASLRLIVDYKIQKLRTKATIRGKGKACLHRGPLGPPGAQAGHGSTRSPEVVAAVRVVRCKCANMQPYSELPHIA